MKHISNIATTKSIFIKKGNIKRIKVIGSVRLTAKKLLHEILEIKKRIEHSKSLLHSRAKREPSSGPKRIKKMIVKNFKTTADIFNGIGLIKKRKKKIRF